MVETLSEWIVSLTGILSAHRRPDEYDHLAER